MEASEAIESDTRKDSFCRSYDKARSDDDVRPRVFNLSVQSGHRKWRPAHARWIDSGRMGQPRCVLHACFGDVRQLGRNAFRAKCIWALDLALAKDVSFAERLRLRFRADAFHVFNRAQYGAPNADLSQVTFGTITTTISNYATGRGTPREFQLSAKISF
jgi:hypothetical protein